MHPGATETCDTVDENCDGSIDEAGVCSGCTQGEHAGHTYQLCTGFGLDWNTASYGCLAFGYYLVTVNDLAENDFLVAQASPLGVGAWWIGYTDQGWGNEGNWEWAAGNGTGFENWAPNEPNNSSNEDCAEITASAGWQWNDNHCSQSKPYVCELD